MKLLKRLLFGKAASGENIKCNISFKTTYPNEILPYNKWLLHIYKQLN